MVRGARRELCYATFAFEKLDFWPFLRGQGRAVSSTVPCTCAKVQGTSKDLVPTPGTRYNVPELKVPGTWSGTLYLIRYF